MTPAITEMLTYCRPAGSASEWAFIERFIAPIPGAYEDAYGNWIVQTSDTARILFSCHTDTVHHRDGRQTIHVTADNIAHLSKRSKQTSSCLGADDTAGCWLMLHMIAANVPGTYVFHYGEERGCLGSRALARECYDWLATFDVAIAFDRRGTTDIITHQNGSRCCSQIFAYSLAAALDTAGLPGYAPEHGIYTDTAEYVDAIAECTNLSVGYASEHRSTETLDLTHLARLRDALVHLDWASLIVDRDPTVPDPDDTWGIRWNTTTPDRDDASEMVLCLTCGAEFGPDDDVCPDCGEDDPNRMEPTAGALMETRDDHSMYLSETYAEVQRELQALFKARTGGDR